MVFPTRRTHTQSSVKGRRAKGEKRGKARRETHAACRAETVYTRQRSQRGVAVLNHCAKPAYTPTALRNLAFLSAV